MTAESWFSFNSAQVRPARLRGGIRAPSVDQAGRVSWLSLAWNQPSASNVHAPEQGNCVASMPSATNSVLGLVLALSERLFRVRKISVAGRSACATFQPPTAALDPTHASRDKGTTMHNEFFNALVAMKILEAHERDLEEERRERFEAECRSDQAFRDMEFFFIDSEMDKLRDTLGDVADRYNLTDDQRQSYWREICKALEPAFATPRGPDKAKMVIAAVHMMRDELAQLGLNQQGMAPQSTTRPVGCCPKCKTLWYHYQHFCIGCGLRRIDW